MQQRLVRSCMHTKASMFQKVRYDTFSVEIVIMPNSHEWIYFCEVERVVMKTCDI